MIWLILIFGFIARAYRTSDFLGFWFDQGRDALAVSSLLHKGEFFLVGPTTGIEGIFLGPFYYYLLAPLYWLGRGNPVYPAIFLALLNIGSIYLMYRLAHRYAGYWAGIIAAALYAFSFQWIGYNRWLSNPTPLPLFAMLAIWWVTSLVHSDRRWWLWPALGLALGLSLQLEAASAIFFIPATMIIFTVFKKDLIVSLKKVFMMLGFFGITLIPQLWFNVRNQNILFNSLYKFLVSEKSFQSTITGFYGQRLAFYFEAFTSKFILNGTAAVPFVLLTITMFVFFWRHLPKKIVIVLSVWWSIPILILLFYHGNNGYVWDYYFTGIYPAVCLLIGITYANVMTGQNYFRWLPIVLLAVVFGQNLPVVFDYYYRKPQAPYIALTPMVAAVDWVYEDAGLLPFNRDEYVPPIIPYAYEYIYQWRGREKFGRQPNRELVKKLYILREPDPGHPTLLNTWLERQSRIGSIEETKVFGAITAERRVRFDVDRR